jgi:6-phosphogluconolactonase (cycloisomerase 2 family)
MRNLTRVGVVAAIAIGLTGAGATAASAAPLSHYPHPSRPSTGVVFSQTDNAAGNAVVAFQRSATGILAQTGTYPTGGQGAALNGSVVDHTASQGSLVRDGSHLFSVNAGSNTVTSFRIEGTRLVRQQIVSSGGDFPVSIAAHGDHVYVLNARDGGSIQGYLNEGGSLIKLPGAYRPLGFAANPTPEFTSTPAQVGFTPDGSQLVVSTKGDGTSFEVFSTRSFGLSAKPIVSTFPGTVPFGFTFDRGGHLVAAEAGTNAVASFSIAPSGTVSQVSSVATGQQATCWIVASGNHLYASNTGSGTVTTVGDQGSGALTLAGNTATDGGTVDASATPDGRFLYVQAGAKGIVDEYAIGADGSLTRIGSVTVPGGAGGEGIVAL